MHINNAQRSQRRRQPIDEYNNRNAKNRNYF